MDIETSSSCSLLQDYDTNMFFKGEVGKEREGVVLGLENSLGSAKELVNPQNVKQTVSMLNSLPKEFNMTLYKLFDNNINKRMPIWKSVNGAASISLLKGRGKQFLIIGEIHCGRYRNIKDLCLSRDKPASPAQLLADLARYTPSFVDIYTEHSEFEYWAPRGFLSGFMGEISEGPDDLYKGPGQVEKSTRGMPCMDFQWIHRSADREAKDAWKMGVCLTSRWHYTDIRELDQTEVDKIFDDDADDEWYLSSLKSGRKNINNERYIGEERFQSRNSSTLEFLLWQGFAGGTGGGEAYEQFVNSSGPYHNKLYKKIGPKLFLSWTKKYLPDNSLESLIRFKMIYANLDNLQFSGGKSYFNLDSTKAKKEAPEVMFFGKGLRSISPLCFALWELAHDTGINVRGKFGSSTSNTTSLPAFLDLIIMYVLLQNDHIIEVLKELTKVCSGSYVKHYFSYKKLWELMFTKSMIGGSPRLKKALDRTTEKDAILTWARNRYDALISKWCEQLGIKEDAHPELLLAISKQTLPKLGEGVFTNKKADTFNSKHHRTTRLNILDEFRRLGELFVDLSVINMDCYTIARMFKKFNVPKGVNQPEEPHTCVLYFGDSHAANVTGFLAQLPGIKLVAANNNTHTIKDERPFPAKGGKKMCCLKLDKFPQPLLWPVDTEHTGFQTKGVKQKQKKCAKYKKTVPPKCNKQPGCKWVTGTGCRDI